MRLIPAVTCALSAVVLASCSGGGAASQPQTITVHGRLVDQGRKPIPFAAVVIGAQDPVFTDGQGEFTIDGVTAPYDVTAVFSGGYLLTYVGLTRTDPTLYWMNFFAGGAGLCRGYVRGTVGPYDAALASVVAAFDSTPSSGAYVRGAWSGGSTWDYALDLSWSGATTLAGTVHALGWTRDPATGLPQGWWGGSAEATATDRVYPSTQVPVTLSALPTGTVSAAATPASGGEVDYAALDVRYPGGTSFNVMWNQATQDVVTYAVPVFAGATFDVTVRARWDVGGTVEARGLGLAPDAAEVPLAMAPPPTLVAPADGAAGLTATTPLTWTPFPDAVHLVNVISGPGGPMYSIVTAASSATLPDLRAHGIELPPSTTASWFVQGLAPFGSTDEVTGEARLERWAQRGSTPTRSFTTAP